MLSGVAGQLQDAQDLDDVATIVRDGIAAIDDAFITTVSVVAADGTHLDQYFSDGFIPADMTARYRRSPLDIDTPNTRVVREASPIFFDDNAQYAESFPDTATEHQRLGAEASAFLPFATPDGDVFGCLSIAWTTPHHHDGPRITQLLEVGDLAARAVGRIQLLQREREIATTLQYGLLTAETRSTSAVVRTFYRSATESLAVGGDWYDVVDLPDGRIGVAVGDVVGRGLPAATTMGQLRAALATAMIHDPDPVAAIAMLDRFAAHLPAARCATAVVAIVDPAHQTVTYASAGHPPPIVATPDGAARLLEGGRSWPLQVDPTGTRAAAAVEPFPDGSLLLLYTDGLVERRGESLGTGINLLLADVRDVYHHPLLSVERLVIERASQRGAGADDIALLTLRSVANAPTMLVEALPADATQLRGQRKRLGAWLAQLGFAPDRLDDVVLAASEATANAIEHGSGGDETKVVTLEAVCEQGVLQLAFADSGRWRAGIEGFLTGRGRGHSLMSAFVDSVDVHTDHQGSTVTLLLSTASGPKEKETTR